MAENNQNVIAADTVIKGEIEFKSGARVLGSIEGAVRSLGELHVGEGANCSASIDAGRVKIEGRVDGNVTASDLVELTSKANLRGDLATAKLIVAEGASFIGHCRIGPNALNGKAAPATAAKDEEPPKAQAAAKK